MGKITIIIMDE